MNVMIYLVVIAFDRHMSFVGNRACHVTPRLMLVKVYN